jgi:hypothetical protein
LRTKAAHEVLASTFLHCCAGLAFDLTPPDSLTLIVRLLAFANMKRP